MDEFILDTEDEIDVNDVSQDNFVGGEPTKQEVHSPVKIIFDEEAHSLGFQSPFAIVIEPVDSFDKGAFIKELVSNNVKFKDDKELGMKYRTFVQKLFNFSDSAFHNPKTLDEEVSRVTTSLNTLQNSIGDVSVKDYSINEMLPEGDPK